MKSRFYEQSNLVVLTNDEGFEFTMTAEQAFNFSYQVQENIKTTTKVVCSIPQAQEYQL